MRARAVTVGPISAASARGAFGTPCPPRSAVMPAESAHDARIARSTSSIVAPGLASNNNAAKPATCGVAIDVPDMRL